MLLRAWASSNCLEARRAEWRIQLKAILTHDQCVSSSPPVFSNRNAVAMTISVALVLARMAGQRLV